jgi:hypothetical protein
MIDDSKTVDDELRDWARASLDGDDLKRALALIDAVNAPPPTFTEREQLCLEFLDDKLFTSAAAVGRHILDQQSHRKGSNVIAVGASVLGRLKRRDMVRYLPDCWGWRISAVGRVNLYRITGGRAQTSLQVAARGRVD